MILNALFGKTYHHGETREEIARLIPELIATLDYERTKNGWQYNGDDAWLFFSEERIEGHDGSWPRPCMRVAINRATGYGALIWYDEAPSPIWVSDNPRPPDFDPRVVADPGYPLFHDPSSTLPLDQVRIALEEFCYSGAGDRPASVKWIRGDMRGRREDREYDDELVTENVEDPWA